MNTQNTPSLDFIAEPTCGEKPKTYGFKPGLAERFLNLLIGAFITIFRIDGKGYISNLFIQRLNPQAEIQFEYSDQTTTTLIFRTGHGRHLWRVKTFFTEEPMMIDWLRTLKPNDIFLDIGANVGMYTIPAASICQQVYACELDPVNIGILKENIHLNKAHGKVVILPFAASDKMELVDIYYRDFSKGDALQSVGRESPFRTIVGTGAHHQQQVSFPLDFIFRNLSLGAPTKVKIDVDGNERIVFAGAKSTILQAQEIYYEDSGLAESAEIVETILAAGFEIHRMEQTANQKAAKNILFKRKERSIQPSSVTS